MGLRPTHDDENWISAAVRWAQPGNGRGPNRSGGVEAVREFDPERAS
jgi:hypothetical protein